MHPLELWQAVILGIVEGITEYLPVSSTGHLIIAGSLMGLQNGSHRQAVDDFEIIIQGGAILAVLGLYWPSIVKMLKGLTGKDADGFKLLVNLVIAFIPSAILGLLLKKWIDAHLFSIVPVLVSMFLGALYMIGADLWGQGRLGRQPTWRSKEMTIFEVTPRQALMIGLMQCASLWPGTSRSMMTITGGMFSGLKPRQAAQFSFLLGLPTLTAATLYSMYKNLREAKKTHTENLFHELGVTACVVGIVVAALAAAATVKWLVSFLTRHGLAPFGWYRIGLCVVLVALSWAGILSISKPGPAMNSGTTVVPPVKWVEPTK